MNQTEPTDADGLQEDEIRRIGVSPDLLELLYRAHIEAVQRFVARRVDDPHRAADLTSEIFLAALTAAPGYRADRGSPRAWLFGIARNVIAHDHRRQRRRLELVQRIQGHRLLDEDAIGRIEERLAAEGEARSLLRALASLPERSRAVVELVDIDGLAVDEAAGVLGIRPGTARVRLHRARARIRADVGADPQTLTLQKAEA
jgi:RNA polymerase sigma-70 factor (ECF subfamily)